MATARNQRAGIDDRWHKRVKQADGTMSTERSAVYGKVKRWRVRWVDAAGKETTKVFDRKPDAQAYLDAHTADVVRGDYVDPKSANETLRSIAEDWYLTKAHRKPKTIAGYRSLLDRFILPRWGDLPLKAIDHQSLTRWIGELSVNGSRAETPLSASTIRQTHQCMSMVLDYAVKSGKVGKNVAKGIERKHDLPTERERRQYALTAEQLLGLVDRMDRYATLTLVLGFCGIRTSEAFALRRENVKDRKLIIAESATRVQGRGIVTTGTKTGRSREVAVPEPVWDRLIAELPEDSWSLVFPNPEGLVLTHHQFQYRLDKAVAMMQAEALKARKQEVAGTGEATTPEFPPITPHDLRHTCASLLISTGANIKVVQRQLGHATAVMTLDKYGKLYDTDLTSAADQLGKLIGATAVPQRYRSR